MIEINNRKAKYDYEILDTIEAGIVLTGTEIKSIKNGSANLKDSYAIIKNGEAFLLNMHISHYEQGNIFNHNETRTRKLLLHKWTFVISPSSDSGYFLKTKSVKMICMTESPRNSRR